MGLAVVTVVSGGMPVVDVTATAPTSGVWVTEAANGFGVPVTKVVGKPGMPVVYFSFTPISDWAVSYTQTLGVDTVAVAPSNLRQRIGTSLLTVSGSKFRLRLQSGSGAEGANILALWAGHAGTGSDFDGTQVQLTVGGSSSFLVPANSQIVTDEYGYPFNKAKDFIVAAYFNSTANDTVRSAVLAGATAYTKSGTIDVGGTFTSGYTANASAAWLVNRIEVFTG